MSKARRFTFLRRFALWCVQQLQTESASRPESRKLYPSTSRATKPGGDGERYIDSESALPEGHLGIGRGASKTLVTVFFATVGAVVWFGSATAQQSSQPKASTIAVVASAAVDQTASLPKQLTPDSLQLPVDSGINGLKLEIRKLRTTARLMQVVAHPDDEDGGMLTLEARGKGVETELFTLTRGEGGQNRLGSGLFDELGQLR